MVMNRAEICQGYRRRYPLSSLSARTGIRFFGWGMRKRCCSAMYGVSSDRLKGVLWYIEI